MSLSILVQPPTRLRRGDNIVPPFAIGFHLPQIQSNGADATVDLGRFFALATLENEENDEVVPAGLAGELTVSLQSVSDYSQASPFPRDYFLFRRLRIQSIGRFRIRVVLIRMDHGDERASVLSECRSQAFDVEDRRVDSQTPSKSREVETLRNKSG